jgi:amino acid transporter
MAWQDLFRTKSLEQLHEEMLGENRLRRVLGPVGLTSLGVGAIIGAGIFVITGRVAANDAGPGVLISYAVAGLACALAALCYAEFASMAPVAGSAYTYAYATLGELLAWIIGWDLILEYAMSAATVAADWTKYFNKLLKVLHIPEVPDFLSNDPFSHAGAWLNLPAVVILGLCTTILVIGIRESAASNTALVLLKLGVVVFVIVVGVGFVEPNNWTGIPVEARKEPQLLAIPDEAGSHAKAEAALARAGINYVQQFPRTGANGSDNGPTRSDLETVTVNVKGQEPRTLVADPAAAKQIDAVDLRTTQIENQAKAVYYAKLAEQHPDTDFLIKMKQRYEGYLPKTDKDREVADAVLARAKVVGKSEVTKKWGMVGQFGINDALGKIDDATRNNFMPYGISGVMLGAALVFFAFIGFDSISTHSEEAVRPQRDVPIGILASLGLCTILYILVAGVITGMVPFPDIDVHSAVASAFTDRAEHEGGGLLNAAGGLIAAGALAGMTSVLLITFLSQARIFLAMARDGLMPQNIFGAVHEKFRTPHISTMLTGGVMMVVAAFTPITTLEEMVNIGTLFAFVVVCSAVLILRIKRPEAHRPFRTPLVFVIAPAGILVNLTLMFFLPVDTWMRLVVWLFIGLCIYFTFGIRHSLLRMRNAAA